MAESRISRKAASTRHGPPGGEALRSSRERRERGGGHAGCGVQFVYAAVHCSHNTRFKHELVYLEPKLTLRRFWRRGDAACVL